MQGFKYIGSTGIALCGLAAMAPAAKASVIATENFAGASGNLSASGNNDTGTGWTTNWTAGTVDGTMTTGLSVPTVPTSYSYTPSGNAAQFTGSSGGNSQDFRTFSTASISSGTYYLSILANVQSPSASTREVGFSLLNNGTDVINIVDYGNGTSSTNYWNLQEGNTGGVLATSNTTAVSLDTTYLLVLGINFSAGTLNLYVNPDSPGAPTNPVATITGATFPTGINEFSTFAGNGSGTSYGSIILDEIRMGTTYADVVPEPCSVCLMLMPAAMLLRRRRRDIA